MPTNQTLIEKLNELEMKLCFQEDLLNSLNDLIAKQDQDIRNLWAANKLMKQNMDEMKVGSGASGEETPPPHY